MDTSNSKMYINKYGTKTYTNSKGQYHRIDGPAIEYVDGSKYWYKDGLYHRTDGPAWEYTNGKKYWNILDKHLKEKDFNSWINRIQIFI